MPLTFKPFINLAEAIALANETGKPVLVKPQCICEGRVDAIGFVPV